MLSVSTGTIIANMNMKSAKPSNIRPLSLATLPPLVTTHESIYREREKREMILDYEEF